MASNTFNTSPYDEPLNLGSKAGLALYSEGTEKVRNSYGGDLEELQPFLSDLMIRNAKCKWNNILVYTINGENYNLLTHHGHFTEAILAPGRQDYLDMTGSPGARDPTHAAYVDPPAVPLNDDGTWDNDPALNTAYRTQIRSIINRRMLYDCIEASLTTKYKKSLSAVLPTMYQDGAHLLW